jgi:hypothetical protein
MARAYDSSAHLLVKRETAYGQGSPGSCESVNPFTPS